VNGEAVRREVGDLLRPFVTEWVYENGALSFDSAMMRHEEVAALSYALRRAADLMAEDRDQ